MHTKNHSHQQGPDWAGWGIVWCFAVRASHAERRCILAKVMRRKDLPALRGGNQTDRFG